MKIIVVLFLGAFLCGALAEPLRYRQAQQVRASARQTDGGVAFQAELGKSANEASGDQETQNDDGESEPVTEPTLTQSAPAPAPAPGPVFYTPPAYPPQGWRPFGQLLVLPFAVRENLESTTTVESSTFNDAETTEETLTTEIQPTNGQLQEEETSEPKTKETAAHKRPPTVIIIKGKKVGQLEVESKQKSTESNDAETADSSTTENAEEAATTTDPMSENLETTSEAESEAVDVENNNEEGKQVNNAQVPVSQAGFFIQLPDGSFQRIVYAAPQTPALATFVPQPANNVQIQQLNQAPNSPFGFNPITNPRIVTFSTQYNAW